MDSGCLYKNCGTHVTDMWPRTWDMSDNWGRDSLDSISGGRFFTEHSISSYEDVMSFSAKSTNPRFQRKRYSPKEHVAVYYTWIYRMCVHTKILHIFLCNVWTFKIGEPWHKEHAYFVKTAITTTVETYNCRGNCFLLPKLENKINGTFLWLRCQCVCVCVLTWSSLAYQVL